MTKAFDYPKVKIFKASAGSGKTHTIAQQFLELTLSDETPESFKKLLAVTFTNKAAEEMKMRIITALTDVINKGKQSSFLSPKFQDFDDKIIRQRAQKVRSEILHGYSFFSISTIDSFFQRIVRTFTLDLRIPATFEIQTDEQEVRNELYNLLMEKLGLEDKSVEVLRNWLINFIIDNISETGKWDIRSPISEIAQLLFKEEFLAVIENTQGDFYSKEKLKQLYSIITQTISDYQQRAKEFKEQLDWLVSVAAEYHWPPGAQFDDFLSLWIGVICSSEPLCFSSQYDPKLY
jgi:ATP-dependent exoDNAse (exonuclease V) beta subunit